MSSSSLSITSIPKFDGSNFAIWSQGLKAYLSYLGIVNHITTTITPPTDAAALLQHQRDAQKASAIVMLLIKDTLWHLIASEDDPKDRYDILEEKYGTAGALSTFSYFQQLFGTRFSEGE